MTFSNPGASSLEQMRLLRLLQWQLQHFLSSVSQEQDKSKISVDTTFNVRIEQPSELGGDCHLQRALSLSVLEGNEADSDRGSACFKSIWVIETAADFAILTPAELYAQAGIANYWQLDLSSVELHTYQQLEASGYSLHRVLQVGDRAFPEGVPITVQLQEPVPLHFMTRTLNGQQTYQTHALPFSFS